MDSIVVSRDQDSRQARQSPMQRSQVIPVPVGSSVLNMLHWFLLSPRVFDMVKVKLQKRGVKSRGHSGCLLFLDLYLLCQMALYQPIPFEG
jgi:hypothetical protein